MGLTELTEVAEYFEALKDFTDYSPTYLIAGSRVVSLLSFIFAILKAASGQLLDVLDFYGSISDSKVQVSKGTLLGEVMRANGMESKFDESKFDVDYRGESDFRKALQAYKRAGHDVKTLLDKGIEARTLYEEAHYTVKELKKAGVGLGTFMEWNLIAGYNPADTKKLISVKEFKTAGFELIMLKDAGIEAIELKAVYSASELKTVGFAVDDLKSAGFSEPELKQAGFNAEQLAEVYTGSGES